MTYGWLAGSPTFILRGTRHTFQPFGSLPFSTNNPLHATADDVPGLVILHALHLNGPDKLYCRRGSSAGLPQLTACGLSTSRQFTHPSATGTRESTDKGHMHVQART